MQAFKLHECDKYCIGELKKPISECKKTVVDGGRGTIYEIDCLGCNEVWLAYQKEAEDIVAPGGQLIADPKERNRVINAAYARLWLHDNRFQWAGLAAFASKQVGCGLLHASDLLEKLSEEEKAAERMLQANERKGIPGVYSHYQVDERAKEEYLRSRENNPVPSMDVSSESSLQIGIQHHLWNQRQLAYHQAQKMANKTIAYQLNYVYERLAMGNTLLFLDVFPLHAFYKKRGWNAMHFCLRKRFIIDEFKNTNLRLPSAKKIKLGYDHGEIYGAFQEIENGNIAESVKLLARHEQVNILQPVMYDDLVLEVLLRGNHFSYITNLAPKVPQAVELTLASQCQRLTDGRTIEFDSRPFANLANVDERMEFVLRAAAQFDSLLNSPDRAKIEASIRNIANGKGVEI